MRARAARSQAWMRAGIGAVLFALPLTACGSGGDAKQTSSGVSITRTPEYSVSSTFSLPTLPTVGGSAAPSASSTPTALPSVRPLAGRVVVLDPGHNGGNVAHPGAINRKVDAGGFQKECDTTGTETTAAGNGARYPEHAFTFDVAQRAAAILRYRGARVVLTRNTDVGVGPCVDQRAEVGNSNSADAAISIHADGGPPAGSGFHVIRPGLLPGRNDALVGPARLLATSVHDAMLATGEATSTYAGSGGFVERTDLGGLNLSAVPKVFVECGNMRNAGDAGRLTDPGFRQRVARALADGLQDYLFGR